MAADNTLGGITVESAARIISAAADTALIIDRNEVIIDATISRPDLKSDLANAATWIGRTWSDIVTEESRPKIKLLLEDTDGAKPPKWRQLAHPSANGEIPILYYAMPISDDRYLAIGRDMRAAAELQKRLIETQASMERDYSLLRHAETRYRVLFHTTPQPILVMDAATAEVVEANPAAVQLFGGSSGQVTSRNILRGLDPESTQKLKSLASQVRNGQSFDDVRIRLSNGKDEMALEVLPFRQSANLFFLLRFIDVGPGTLVPPQLSPASVNLLEFTRRSTDGCVVIDHNGRVQTANAAFVQMAQLVNEDQAHGQLVERWLGRSGVDMSVIIANLRHNETVTLFATVLRGEYGASADVEVSGFGLGRDNYGLAIRNVGRRLSDTSGSALQTPRTVEQLKELIGRVSLKDMVRESTDMIEKLCIEAALELTGDNRASAAEMLGLSRQSLYVKMRRYGMADDTIGAERESS